MTNIVEVDRWKHVEHIIYGLLGVLGFDPDKDENLKETPRRVAGFWREFLEYDPGSTAVTFEAIQVDQLIIVKGIPAFSMCSHHLLPMMLKVTVGYIPTAPEEGGLVMGLSKIPRIVQKYAHRLQLQERLASQIADELVRSVKPLGVGVVIEGVHMCMAMRGIRSEGSMIVSDMRGALRDVPAARSEFLSLIGGA